MSLEELRWLALLSPLLYLQGFPGWGWLKGWSWLTQHVHMVPVCLSNSP